MKTLENVIEELHYWDTCDAYPESFYDFEVTRDALHYLKEYRKHLKEDVAENAITEVECAENAHCKDAARALRTEKAWQEFRKENGL